MYARMCKQISIWAFVAAIAVSLFGCSKDVRDSNRQSAGIRPSPGQSASGAKSMTEKVNEDGPRAHGKQDPDYVKLKLAPGLTPEQITDLFGTKYTEVVHPKGGTRMWRYDFADVGYQYQAAGDTGTPPGSTLADVSGLRRGMVHGQLFVGWDAKTGKTGYSEYYYITDRHNEHDLRLFTVYPDGKTADQLLPIR